MIGTGQPFGQFHIHGVGYALLRPFGDAGDYGHLPLQDAVFQIREPVQPDVHRLPLRHLPETGRGDLQAAHHLHLPGGDDAGYYVTCIHPLPLPPDVLQGHYAAVRCGDGVLLPPQGQLPFEVPDGLLQLPPVLRLLLAALRVQLQYLLLQLKAIQMGRRHRRVEAVERGFLGDVFLLGHLELLFRDGLH